MPQSGDRSLDADASARNRLNRPVRPFLPEHRRDGKCLSQGHYAASYSSARTDRVGRDRGTGRLLTVEGSSSRIGERQQTPPKSFVPDGLQLGIHVSGTGPGVEVSRGAAGKRSNPAQHGAVVLRGSVDGRGARTDGPASSTADAAKPSRAAGFSGHSLGTTPLGRDAGACCERQCRGVPLRHPYPIVLTNQDPPDTHFAAPYPIATCGAQ